MKKVIVMILLLMGVSPLWALDWTEIEPGISYSPKSLIKNTPRVSVWVKTRFDPPKNQVQSIVAHETYDCQEKTYITAVVRFLDAKGQVIHSDNYTEKGFLPVVKGSVSEAKSQFFCGLLKQ